MNSSPFFRLDWLSILIYFLLVSFGILNIYSSIHTDTIQPFWDISHVAGKQFWIFIGCCILLPLVLFIKSNLFEHLSYVFYGISILSLIGLFIFGQTISGATSWYNIGGIGLQPSEFAKLTTALVLANFLSGLKTDIRRFRDQIKIMILVGFPMLLILIQPDAGSALVFFGLFFVFLREGMNLRWLYLGILLVLVFVLTLLFKPLMVCIGAATLLLLLYFILRKSYSKKSPFLITLGICLIFSFSVDLIFNSIFEQRHRDRFNIILGLETDSKGIGYNINQSKIAIGSGGFSGKGYLNGTQTKGDFVPEQHTDYIFSTVGEEWGFLGASFIIILFTTLMLRISKRAELQRNIFSKIYSYSAVTIIFTHFFINIGMFIGLVPTIGIPLPFLSYGGSSLMAFILLFSIYIKLDSQRTSKW